jgi:sec-independent protein translocase protein TatC
MALVPFPKKALTPAPGEERVPDWDEDDSDRGGKMSFLEHLDELRKRIIWALVSIVGGFGIACFFLQRIFEFVMKPMQAALPKGQTLIYTEPTEALMLYLKMALLMGVLIGSPGVMTQVWLFVAPGLYANEKKLAIPFVICASGLFISGAAFSHYVLFPLAWRFFASFSNEFIKFTPRVEPVFDLYVRLILALGVVFQLPILMFVLARFGIVTARFLIKNFKYAVLIMFVVAAVVTPDGSIVNQVVMAAPMIALYIISIGVAWVFGKKRTAEEDSPA